MLTAIIPFIVLLLGLAFWFMSKSAKVQKIGEYMVFCAILVLTWHFAGETLTLFHR
jgi:Na+/phosphate symporter